MMALSWLGILFLMCAAVLASSLLALVLNKKTRWITISLVGVFASSALIVMLVLGFLIAIPKTVHQSEVIAPDYPRTPAHVRESKGNSAVLAALDESVLQAAIVIDESKPTSAIAELKEKVIAKTEIDSTDQPAESKVAEPSLEPAQSKAEENTKPAWVDAPPKVVGDVYQMSVNAGPYTTREECNKKLPDVLQGAIDQYVETCLGEPVPGVRLSARDFQSQIVKEQWEEIRQLSVGPMIMLHARLEFDRKLKDLVMEKSRQVMIRDRLYFLSTLATGGLGLLAVAYGYLKTDLATQGTYRGRLRIGAAAVILGIIAAVVAAG